MYYWNKRKEKKLCFDPFCLWRKIIDWSFRLFSFKYDDDECNNGGAGRLTIEIEFDNSLGHDHGGINEQAESVW